MKFRASPRTTHAVLWDLDLTLLDAGPGTAEIISTAIARCLGRTERPSIEAGHTEREVVVKTLRKIGFTPSSITLNAIFSEIGRETLRRAPKIRRDGRVMPGARNVLARLSDQYPAVVQTLVTGSYRASAEARLSVFKLGKELDLELGAYGEEAMQKSALFYLASERIMKATDTFKPLRGWVVSDTKADAQTARAANLRCLLVGTGRERHDPVEAMADAVVPDMGAVETIVSLLGKTLEVDIA